MKRAVVGRVVWATLALLFLGVGCTQLATPAPTPSPPPSRPLPTPSAAPSPLPLTPTSAPSAPRATEAYPVQPALVPRMGAFGFDLFHRVVASAGGNNVFISPLSIELALAMTYNGAAGETQQAMARVLQIEGLSLQQVNEANAGLRQSLLRPDSGVTLTIASSLWGRTGVDFNADFLERDARYYGAEVAALDFDRPEASQTINAWVKRSTGDKIEKIVPDQIDPSVVLYLINAVYFEGQWQTPFVKSATKEGAFHLDGGGEKQVPLMTRRATLPYTRGQGFQAIQLPYRSGRMHMVIFLPDPDASLDAFLGSLNAENWERWMAGFKDAYGLVSLPRFKTESDLTLNDALKALDMAVAFDEGRADFSAMRPIPPALFISEVKHKTFVEVDEAGTVAAAATSVEMGLTSVLDEAFSFVADRPFFYAIRDSETGAVLFMGVLRAP